MFERFTDHARRVVVAAQDEARLLGHNHIGSEHLLLGLLNVSEGMAAHVLTAAGVSLEAARAQVEELAGPRNRSPAGRPVPFTSRAKKVMELSLREALQRKDHHIGTEHMLLGLLQDVDGLGPRILEQLGEPLPALRQRTLEAASAAASDAGAADTEAASVPRTETWRQSAHKYGQEAGFPPQSFFAFRELVTSVDQRLAAIEGHLGISVGADPVGGFAGLVMSVTRRLGNIERHLGVGSQAEKPQADPE